jgi:AhpD family alkylhydroperoxidase
MARLPSIDPDAIQDPLVQRGFEDMTRRMGAITENLSILAHKPVYVGLIISVSEAIDAETEIDPVLKQLVELKVARLNGCEYSVDLLEGCLIRRGVTEAKLHELDFYEDSSLYDERERLALQLAEQMVLDSVGDTLFHQIRQSFSIIETLELVVSVALENFYSLVNRTLGLKAQGFRERAIAERANSSVSEQTQ